MTLLTKPQCAPVHGGDIVSASQTYNIPIDKWLDLSTGINPCAYPIPAVHDHFFRALPYQSREFSEAVSTYYGSDSFIASNGSQQVIQLLPTILEPMPVMLPEFGYQEHRHAWMLNTNDIESYPAFDLCAAKKAIEKKLSEKKPFHLVIINPNNPTGMCFEPLQLATWADQLSKGAMLIIDEAFIDAVPRHSVLVNSFRENMLVLRSFGKFFGLAGLRLGFTFASSDLIDKLKDKVGIWDVNGPAQAIATQALSDNVWIANSLKTMRVNADKNRTFYSHLFNELTVSWQVHHALFSSYQLDKHLAENLYEYFASQGILIRLVSFSESTSLIRMGQIDHQNIGTLERLKKVFNEFLQLYSQSDNKLEKAYG